MTGTSRIAVICVLTFATLLAACGGGETSDGCPRSSKEEPLSNLYSASCRNWNLKFGTATLVPNDVILQANMFNDVSDFKSWVVVEAILKYKGSDTGRISDAISSSAFLVGSKNLTYAANDKTPTFSELKDAFAPIPYNASSPYSGGVVTISMWFWVDNDDSDFLLGLFVGDTKTDEPNLWIDVSTQSETEVSSSEGATESPALLPCDPTQLSDGKGGILANETLSNCDYSQQDWSGRGSFAGRDLRGANFSGANLAATSFSYSGLTGANFGGANLTGAEFRWAILDRANLAMASLAGADFTMASLVGADLSYADLTGADISTADLTGAILDNATMPDGTIND